MIIQKITNMLTLPLLFLAGIPITLQAALIDNLDGTVTQTRIDGSQLMWLQDASYAYTSGFSSSLTVTWDEAVAFIDHLNATNHLGYNDWQMPSTNPVNDIAFDYNWSNDGSTDQGHNNISPNSQLSYMFYQELNGVGQYDVDGNENLIYGLPSCGIWCTDIGPFTHYQGGLGSFGYWASDVDVAPDQAWQFDMAYGTQYVWDKFDIYENPSIGQIWAVRDVSAEPVPAHTVPSVVLLLVF